MLGPTLSDTVVRSTMDARLIFHAVAQQKLRLITRRLTIDERRTYIRAGAVFVWEERGPSADSAGSGIERWTDGKRWGPSRVRDEFLFYYEQPRETQTTSRDALGSRDRLIKQTFSVYVNLCSETKKWHLVAYYTQHTVTRLKTIDRILSCHASLPDVGEVYRNARTTKGRPRGEDLLYEQSPTQNDQRHDEDRYPGGYPFAYPDRQNSAHAMTPRVSNVFTGFEEHAGSTMYADRDRVLAPLVYLQNVSAPPRPSYDDFAIRALDSIMV